MKVKWVKYWERKGNRNGNVRWHENSKVNSESRKKWKARKIEWGGQFWHRTMRTNHSISSQLSNNRFGNLTVTEVRLSIEDQRPFHSFAVPIYGSGTKILSEKLSWYVIVWLAFWTAVIRHNSHPSISLHNLTICREKCLKKW
jgi:hypothetical protein